MKRQTLLLFLLTCLAIPTRAQTWAEWFRQKETQKAYLVQQIAALQAYAGTLRQGYAVLDRGISTVQHIKNGDLGLHQVYFHSLRQVSPVIGESAKLTDILTWQAAILGDFTTAIQALRQQGQLHTEELAYLEQVRAQVLQDCHRDLEGLWLLTSNGLLDLSDDERLRQLDAIHQAMSGRFRFTRHFLGEAQALSLLRTRVRAELKNTRRFQGIP